VALYKLCIIIIIIVNRRLFVGTNVDAARDILEKSGLAIKTGSDFEDAAIKAVASLKQ